MSRILLALAATAFVALLQGAPAHAQASRTWVSGVGDDANPCSRTAPCKTFAGAISKTALNGEINCLDPGGFGAVTITKSITIDCHEVFASILNSGTNGVNIPFDSFNAADIRKTVRLRNINFNGIDTGVNGIRITGGALIAAGVVLIEDFGITVNPAPAGLRLDVAFDNVRVQNTNNIGIFISNNGRAMINRAVVTGNVQIGIGVRGLLAAAEANVSNSVVSNNGLGIGNLGGTVTLRVSNNDISFNNTAFSGVIQSHVNNRVEGNGALGTAPTPTGLQ